MLDVRIVLMVYLLIGKNLYVHCTYNQQCIFSIIKAWWFLFGVQYKFSMVLDRGISSHFGHKGHMPLINKIREHMPPLNMPLLKFCLCLWWQNSLTQLWSMNMNHKVLPYILYYNVIVLSLFLSSSKKKKYKSKHL